MTLIISAYDYEEQCSFVWKRKKSEFKRIPNGICSIADSVITHPELKGVKLATSFRKTYETDIKVYQPHFGPHGVLIGFHQVHTTHKCLISIAGSTLVAQHALNLISTHLANLQYVFDLQEKKIQNYTFVRKKPDDHSRVYRMG